MDRKQTEIQTKKNNDKDYKWINDKYNEQIYRQITLEAFRLSKVDRQTKK